MKTVVMSGHCRVATIMCTCALSAALFAAWFALRLELPDLDAPARGAVLLDRNGLPLRIVLDDREQEIRPVGVAEISPWARAALVSVEDQRFYRHAGLDGVAIARAVLQNMASGRRISGASTLTTQVVRLSQPRRRTWRTKMIEALLAIRLERRHEKDAILEAHLNLAPFGGNLTGIEAAARRYFDKSAADLNLSEAALLAGLPQSPSRLRPDRHPGAAHRRMGHVLDRMARDGIITAEQHARAMARPPSLASARRPFLAPHFTDFVLRHGTPRGRVRTTLDLEIQTRVEHRLLQHHARWAGQGAMGAAVIVMQVEDGAVLAMAGSPDYFAPEHGMVNAATAVRSPGSALKPLIYALAIDQGMMTPATRIEDRPAGYRDINPSNFDGQFLGSVTLREAAILSLNIPAMKTVERIGQQRVLDHLRALGLGTIDGPAARYGTGIAIGGAEVRLLDLVAAYACLARGGRYLPPRFMEGPIAEGRMALSAEAAYIVADMHGGPERSMDLFGHAADAELPRAAWKTGTSSGYRDAWTVAWTPEVVVGVWIGNPDGSPTGGLTGATAAAPLAGDILRALKGARPATWFVRPANVHAISMPDGEYDLVIGGVTAPAATLRAPARPAVRILAPPDGAAYRIPAGRTGVNTLALTAESGDPSEPLYWFANGRPIGRTVSGQPLHWPLPPGEWTLACASADGAEARVTITADRWD